MFDFICFNDCMIDDDSCGFYIQVQYLIVETGSCVSDSCCWCGKMVIIHLCFLIQCEEASSMEFFCNVREMRELKKRDILKKYGRKVGMVNKRESV